MSRLNLNWNDFIDWNENMIPRFLFRNSGKKKNSLFDMRINIT